MKEFFKQIYRKVPYWIWRIIMAVTPQRVGEFLKKQRKEKIKGDLINKGIPSNIVESWDAAIGELINVGFPDEEIMDIFLTRWKNSNKMQNSPASAPVTKKP